MLKPKHGLFIQCSSLVRPDRKDPKFSRTYKQIFLVKRCESWASSCPATAFWAKPPCLKTPSLEGDGLCGSTLPQLKSSLFQLWNHEELSVLFLFKHSSPEITCRMKGGLMSTLLGLFRTGTSIFHGLFFNAPYTGLIRKKSSPSWLHMSCTNIPKYSSSWSDRTRHRQSN